MGISGGVDSAVAALCLLRSGYDVQGLHMTNWDEHDAYCTAAADYQAARRVCEELGIPLHRVNFSAAYRKQVFADFLAEYAAGRTPNPDVLCNRYIKFGAVSSSTRGVSARNGSRPDTTRRLSKESGTRLLKAADTAEGSDLFPARGGTGGPVSGPLSDRRADEGAGAANGQRRGAAQP